MKTVKEWPSNERIDAIGTNGNDGLHYPTESECPLSPNFVDKPTYTQAMCDSGELPSVGMECKVFLSSFDKDGEEGVIEFNNEQGRLFRYKSNNLCDYYADDDGSLFEPLSPLEDGKAYQFDYGNTLKIIGLYRKQNKQLQAVAGYYESKHCTNIKPLTVEGE